ncbi:hypothetical protein C2L64_46100 [Paraburkholderia hospita]|uniref:UvrD-like helicase C-terminal domain-containing protein n=1 Tax=Paraburkholderia hospita TaxID=169430 RepID=A0AAN1JMH1_9BURK|nr:hypothetical protein C2L64_46100 [Paraburkholderia hospita]
MVCLAGADTRRVAASGSARCYRQILHEKDDYPDIALLTFNGRDRSTLSTLAHIGHHALRGFMGDYDEHGAPRYRDGEITMETVYRFKGQSAPCVILTGVDFEQFDDTVFRRLFVGATRATMKLIVVMSDRAAAQLIERMP